MPPDYVWWGPMWFFPMVVPIIMVFALALYLYWMFGRSGIRPPWHDDRAYSQGGSTESALEILKKRYAKGEITKEEFEQIRRDILT